MQLTQQTFIINNVTFYKIKERKIGLEIITILNYILSQYYVPT